MQASPQKSRPSFICPRCGAESFNPNDIRERYCGRCHVFVDDAAEEPKKRGRPATGVKEPWKELNISKATYYRRIRLL